MALGLQDPRGLSGKVGRALGGVEGVSRKDEVDGRCVEWQAAVVPRDDELRIEGDRRVRRRCSLPRGMACSADGTTRGSWPPHPRPQPAPLMGWAPGMGAHMAGPCR